MTARAIDSMSEAPRLADLRAFTPVALNLDRARPSIDWGDLRGVRFAEPFFDRTVERWAGGDPPPLVRTGLDALAALDAEPSLDPSAILMHCSRCGSSLIARQLATLPGMLVVAEAGPINTLLMEEDAALDADGAALALRLLVRALGRRRFGDERGYVLKLSSWNVRRLARVRRAFPDTPLIWLQRAPDAVAASLIKTAPGWLALQRRPLQAESLFGIAAERVAVMEPDEFCVRALGSLYEAARGIGGDALHLDYDELPEAAWRRVAPFLGLAPAEAEIARMRETARLDAKAAAARPFAPDAAAAPALPPMLGALVAAELAPLYRGLDGRRAAARDRRAPACL